MTRKDLLAYLEGRLSPTRRLMVRRELESSPHLRAELEALQRSRMDLQQELSLLVRQSAPGLNALLPEILQQQSRTPRFSEGVQIAGVQVGIIAVILLIFIFLAPLLSDGDSGSVHAAGSVQSLQNVPGATSTPNAEMLRRKETAEANRISLHVEEEPGNVFGQSASPVPMPGATLEASVEPFQP